MVTRRRLGGHGDTWLALGGHNMAMERGRLQDTFLQRVQQDRTPLTIFLINGVRLQGFVAGFDSFCLLLQRDGHAQLVYKREVATVVPSQPIGLYERPDKDQAPAPQEQSRLVVVERKRRLPLRS